MGVITFSCSDTHVLERGHEKYGGLSGVERHDARSRVRYIKKSKNAINYTHTYRFDAKTS